MSCIIIWLHNIFMTRAAPRQRSVHRGGRCRPALPHPPLAQLEPGQSCTCPARHHYFGPARQVCDAGHGPGRLSGCWSGVIFERLGSSQYPPLSSSESARPTELAQVISSESACPRGIYDQPLPRGRLGRDSPSPPSARAIMLFSDAPKTRQIAVPDSGCRVRGGATDSRVRGGATRSIQAP